MHMCEDCMFCRYRKQRIARFGAAQPATDEAPRGVAPGPSARAEQEPTDHGAVLARIAMPFESPADWRF